MKSKKKSKIYLGKDNVDKIIQQIEDKVFKVPVCNISRATRGRTY